MPVERERVPNSSPTPPGPSRSLGSLGDALDPDERLTPDPASTVETTEDLAAVLASVLMAGFLLQSPYDAVDQLAAMEHAIRRNRFEGWIAWITRASAGFPPSAEQERSASGLLDMRGYTLTE